MKEEFQFKLEGTHSLYVYGENENEQVFVPDSTNVHFYGRPLAIPFVRKDHVEELAAALRSSLTANDQHYSHFDEESGAGSTCPACVDRRRVNGLAREALSRYEGIYTHDNTSEDADS